MLTIRHLTGIAKPEYLLRPHQIARRAWREFTSGRSGVRVVRLPWGLDIAVDVGESIGWAIYSRALYETAVTETLWRLAEPGDTVVDGGANVGYMTSLLAVRVGKRGKIYCFEPHPEVFRSLQENVARWQGSGRFGSFLLYQKAMGDREATATLRIPDHFPGNQGTSWVEAGEPSGDGQSIPVRVLALDNVFPPQETIAVVKLDVEGYELRALKGMEHMLREHRVRHVLFEEHAKYPAATHRFLREMGYQNLGITHHFSGVRCVPNGCAHHDPINGSPPSYVATLDAEFTISRLQKGFWRSFGPARLLRR